MTEIHPRDEGTKTFVRIDPLTLDVCPEDTITLPAKRVSALERRAA